MRWSVLFLIGILIGCGSATDDSVEPFDASVATQVAPVVTRINPATGRAGDIITIFGVGFSVIPEDNIVLLTKAAAATSALSYNLASPAGSGEVEQLTFVIPTNATAGITAVIVNVYDNSSNSDITLLVNP